MGAPRLRSPVRVLTAGLVLLSSACSPRPAQSADSAVPVAAATEPAARACDLAPARAGSRVLVFSRTKGFRHGSIPDGIAAVKALGAQHGFAVEATEDPTAFTDQSLGRFAAVVFMSTTGDVLDSTQQAAFQRYIRSGHGFVGVHSATDTEYDWPWYGQLVGAYFSHHPEIQAATVLVDDRTHPSTAGLPERWERTDEWYDFRAKPRAEVQVLARLDESTYRGGMMGSDHPIAWWHDFDGGRAWYTAGGHTAESYREPLFLQHLLGGIQYAIGDRREGT
jgi:cytochrome c